MRNHKNGRNHLYIAPDDTATAIRDARRQRVGGTTKKKRRTTAASEKVETLRRTKGAHECAQNYKREEYKIGRRGFLETTRPAQSS